MTGCPVTTLDWDALPRLLSDLCDMGHYREALYRLDYPSGGSTWLCRGCYIAPYTAAGRPPQHHRYCDVTTHRPRSATWARHAASERGVALP